MPAIRNTIIEKKDRKTSVNKKNKNKKNNKIQFLVSNQKNQESKK